MGHKLDELNYIQYLIVGKQKTPNTQTLIASWSFNAINRCESNVWKGQMDPLYVRTHTHTHTHIHTCVCVCDMYMQIISASALVRYGTVEPHWTWNGNHYRGITGGYFQKLFTPKCRLSDPDSLDHLMFFLVSFRFLFVTSLVPINLMRACQDDESNPLPFALK